MNKLNQQQLNPMPQEHYPHHVSEALSQEREEELKKQRESLRKKIFFTSIPSISNNINHNSNISNQCSEDISVFDTLRTANFSQVKDIFIQEVNQFIEVTNYFAENKYTEKLENLIIRIQGEKQPEDKSKLIDHLRCCVLSLHDLTLVLNNLEYQLQHNTSATKNIFSKDTIACYLDACIVDLDKCWAGISSRFIHQYNTLSSLDAGISGRINIIKKELLDAVLTEYLNAKKQDNSYLFMVGDEVHIRNALNNTMHQILGIDKIKDPLANNSLASVIKQEFIELATIEISPARITSMLADGFYQDLTMILDKYSMSSWLTEFKSDDQLHPDSLIELNSNFYDKINILFDASEENKLNIYSLLDVIATEKGDTYSFHRSREKLQQWIAKRLISNPDAETIFIKDIDNGFTIWSIDYIFFNVSKTADNNNYSDSKNHIRLQLSHLQDKDIINFTDVEVGNKCYLSDYKEKTTTSITLVTQAMEQTDDAPSVVKFIVDNITKLAELPLLKNKVKNIINSKLINVSFKQQFSDAIVKLIENKYDFNADEIYYLLNNSTCNDSLIAIIKQDKVIDYLLESINIKYLDNITVEFLNKISDNTKKLLFNRAVNAHSCEILYKLLCDSDFNKYITENNIINKNKFLDLATKYNHTKLAKLLLQDKTLNIKNYHLSHCFYYGYSEMISLYITHILDNKDRFTTDTLIKILQFKSENGCLGLYVALQKGHDEIVKEYIKTILNTDQFTKEQKLNLIEAKSETGYPGLYIALQNGHDEIVKEYIKTMLNTDQFTKEQKLNLIEAKSETGYPGLYIALQNGHDEIVKEYINAILNTNQFTEEQKLNLIQAKSKDGFYGVFIALYNGHNKTVKEYINAILNTNQFTEEQKLNLIEAKSKDGSPGLFIALYKGHNKTVTEYINAILNTNQFTKGQKLNLIEAKSENGYLGLFTALQKGHNKTVTEYINAILKTNQFTEEQKLNLIEAKSENSYPGLYLALQNGHKKTVIEYINAILNIDIDGVTTEQKLKIIEAKTEDGYPGLFIVLQYGYNEIVATYINAILSTNQFTEEQKLNLIEAKTENGYPGLYIALQNGHNKTVTGYINAILNTNQFTEEQKLNLIEATNKNGCPGLYIALQEGHNKTVIEYINAILNTNQFTDKQKLNLIEAKTENGYLGLFIALQNGYNKTVTEYFNVIVASKKLPLEQKRMLFTDISTKSLALLNELVNNSDLTVEEKNHLLTVNSSECTIL